MNIEPDMVTVQWTCVHDNTEMCNCFKLEGYTMENLRVGTPYIRITPNATTVVIPSDNLTTTAGEPIYYRFVANNSNGTICTHGETNMYYGFNGKFILGPDPMKCLTK